MEEKTLFKGCFSTTNIPAIILTISGIVLMLFDYIFLMECDMEFLLEAFELGYGEMYIMLLALLCIIIAIVLYMMMRNCKLIITDKRIYGQAAFGKQVSLPLNKISSAAINAFGKLSVSTSSGNISFWLLTNGSEAWQIINTLIIKQQK